MNSTGFGYDANGNLTNMPNGTTLNYDVENRLASYNNSEFYGYGPQNHRVWKKEPSGSEEIHFFAPNGTHLGTYKPVVTSGTLSLQTIDTDLHYVNRSIRSRGNMVLRDRLGSVRAWGTTVMHSYLPFGEEQTATASDHDKFGTYYRDTTTGIDFARNRYYNSTYGTFLTADPYGASARASDPGSWNRYTYAGNDPVNANDPSGMDLVAIGDGWDLFGGGGGGGDGGWGDAGVVDYAPTSETGSDTPFWQLPTPPPYVDNGGDIYGSIQGPSWYTTTNNGSLAYATSEITYNGSLPNWLVNLDTQAQQFANWMSPVTNSSVMTSLLLGGSVLMPFEGLLTGAATETAGIATPYATEFQSWSAEAQDTLAAVQNGATLYRTGQLGVSMAGESQYWSLQNPLTPGYASQMGLPGVSPDFVVGGKLIPGASVITNGAVGLGGNAGGGIQVVTSPNGVATQWFYVP